MARIHEVEEVAEPNRHRWLAGQIDEVEAKLLTAVTDLSSVVKMLTTELTTTREEMGRSSSRVVWAVMTATISLLVGVSVVVITGAIGGK